MHGKRGVAILVATLALTSLVVWRTAAEKPTQARRDNLQKAYQAGNYKDAYEGLRQMALDPADDPARVGDDMNTAVECLQKLGRSDEIDAFREGVIAAHAKNWRLLETAAKSYASNRIEHWGYIIAGKFYQGSHRGGGRYVNAMPRDRVRALQLMQQALPLTAKETDKAALASFHTEFANLLLNGAGWHAPWRLQELTDLGQLPDYEDGYWYRGNTRGAPVDAEGNPVYYRVPKSYQAAANDGERWRWMLAQAVEFDAGRAGEVDMILANFCRSQFGVQTMAAVGYRFPTDEDRPRKTGTFALHTLKDDETIARLATGVKRFKVPDEFNWIKICERVAGRGRSQPGEQARDMLAQVYEDRRQYVKAAETWKKALAEYGPGLNGQRQKRLEQVVGNWGRFENIQVQPAGQKATVDFRFRNGDKVSFEAFAVNVPKLLDDIKAYLKSNPGQVDWQKTYLGNIGYRLVEENQRQYVGDKVASWDLALKPRPEHVDERVTVTTPLDKPGAYLLTARMAGGNLSRVIVWVSDTVIAKKQLDGQAYYFVADAVTGAPVAKADVEFFGWKSVQVQPNQNRYRVDTIAFKETADRDGQIILGPGKQPQDFQWLITARKAGAGAQGADRFAYLGFTGVWHNRIHDPEYNQSKALLITDRPVYRPEQKVQFKAWVEHAKYDQQDNSAFAGRPFDVRILNPKGEKVYEKTFTTDTYGGLDGEFSLSKGMTLGVYSVQVGDWYAGTFRVEEYKKPEFEVQGGGAGGAAGRAAAGRPQELRRHRPVGRLRDHRQAGLRGGIPDHAGEPDRLEGQVLGHGARHPRRPGRGRGRHPQEHHRPPASAALLRAEG
jgi:hypothetical protein